jgi:hypothetical protein
VVGVSANGKEAIATAVEEMFDRIAFEFVGDIPRLKASKNLFISHLPNNGLSSIFVQAMGNRNPNIVERDVLRSLLVSADGYIQALKATTRTNVTERVDALAREAKFTGSRISTEAVNQILSDELNKARSKMQTIAEAESTKLRNMGAMVDIAKVGASYGETDPTVFFVVTRDGSTCKECIRLHLMPNQLTPRLWKLSQLNQGWHKRGEETPCVAGLHPHCRCSMTIMAPGFGFNKDGLVEYKSDGHNEMSKQRA